MKDHINQRSQNYTFKIMTYNIHSGRNIWMISKFEKVLEFLKKQHLDIIALQEVNENRLRGHQVSKLEQYLKMNVHFGKNLYIADGYYGIATLSPYSIVKKKQIPLPTKQEPRGLLHTKINLPSTPVHILNTHLSLSRSEREKQIYQINKYIANLESPFVLMGDFNTTHPYINDLMRDTGKEMKKEHQPTVMLTNKRIDFIYISSNITLLNYQVLPVKMSDHFPVIVEVAFNK